MCVYRIPSDSELTETKRFKEGNTYRNNDFSLPSILIIKRTAKMCLVEEQINHNQWRMKIKEVGNHEEMTDTSVPKGFRREYTYTSIYENLE